MRLWLALASMGLAVVSSGVLAATPVSLQRDGSLQIAIDAMSSARTPHSFLGIDFSSTNLEPRQPGLEHGAHLDGTPQWDDVDVGFPDR